MPGLLIPGIYDALSAKLASQADFPVAFMSGYAVAGTLLGEPDIGLLTQTEVIEQARKICHAATCHLIVDADTGYGNEINVNRTVTELIAIGAKGCFLEDQVWPKRCGHMQGKKVIDADDFVNKIRAAVTAKNDRDFFITARTDAIAALSINDAIARALAAKSAGADACFVEAPRSAEDMKLIAREVPGPLVANMVEGGATPMIPRDELFDMGFTIVIYPISSLFAATKAVKNILHDLQQHGSTVGTEVPGVSFSEFTSIVGLQERIDQSSGDT